MKDNFRPRSLPLVEIYKHHNFQRKIQHTSTSPTLQTSRTLSELPIPQPILDMSPFDGSGFRDSNLSRFNFGRFNSTRKNPLTSSLTTTSPTIGPGGGQHRALALRRPTRSFQAGASCLPRALLASWSQRVPRKSSDQGTAGPYEGPKVLTAKTSNTPSNSFETIASLVDSLAGTGKSHRRNPHKFSR